MKPTYYNDTLSTDEFKSSLMLAIAFHLFLILMAFIIGRFFTTAGPDEAALEILKASVRVDIVGMPKLTIQELRKLELPSEAQMQAAADVPAQSKETVTEAPPKPDDVVMPAKEAPKKPLSSFLSDYSSKKLDTPKAQAKNPSPQKIEGLDSLILEGNKISKGTALVGETSDIADTMFVGYVQTLPEKIREQWRLPTYLREQVLTCRIHIWIGARGEILKTQIRESSGNSDYDARAVAAIKAASLSAPPSEIVSKISTRGIVLGFPL